MSRQKSKKQIGKRYRMLLVLLFPMVTVAVIASIIAVNNKNPEWSGINKDNLIENVRRHVELPKGNPEQVFRIQDAKVIRKEGDFYKDAEDGDWVIIYSSKAVIYDGRKDVIRNVVEKGSGADIQLR